MDNGLIKLYRSPLRDGETVYTLGCIEQGTFEDGNHKGEKKPLLMSLKPSVMDDGRMLWEMLDTPGNRVYCESLLPKTENPAFIYSVVYPGDTVSEKVQDHESEHESKRKPGRPVVHKREI